MIDREDPTMQAYLRDLIENQYPGYYILQPGPRLETDLGPFHLIVQEVTAFPTDQLQTSLYTLVSCKTLE